MWSPGCAGCRDLNHHEHTREVIGGVLWRARTIAMVGASATSNRPSYFAMKYLLGKGCRVIPVNPGLAGQDILGQPVFPPLAASPPPAAYGDLLRSPPPPPGGSPARAARKAARRF